MIGLLFLVNLPEAVNGTEHYGKLHPDVADELAQEIARSSSSSTSSSSSSSSGTRRMLLADSSSSSGNGTGVWTTCYSVANDVKGTGSVRRRRMVETRRSLASSGGLSCPELKTSKWGFCRDFAPSYRTLDKTLKWAYNVKYVGARPFTADGETYTCTV